MDGKRIDRVLVESSASFLSPPRLLRATLTNAQVGPLDLASPAGRDSASTRTRDAGRRTGALPSGDLLIE